MYAQFQAWLTKLSFNYFDLIVLVALAVGLLRGRKHGMSQELLPMLKWVAIVTLGGFFYRPVSLFLQQNIPGAFDLLWANRSGYLLIALGVLLVFAWIKKAIGEKLLGSDLFGGAEYYLGMIGGMVRAGCIIVAVLALMNSRIVTQEELAADEAAQKKSLEDIRLPTYGTIQQAMLLHSFTGRLVKENLSRILIVSVTSEQMKKGETAAQKREDVINQVLGTTNK
ncbi:MAG: CvpA family protein [Verrucomicrobiota bacterium]|jgi:uncharacterized membrane protein required for colicin V production